MITERAARLLLLHWEHWVLSAQRVYVMWNHPPPPSQPEQWYKWKHRGISAPQLGVYFFRADLTESALEAAQ